MVRGPKSQQITIQRLATLGDITNRCGSGGGARFPVPDDLDVLHSGSLFVITDGAFTHLIHQGFIKSDTAPELVLAFATARAAVLTPSQTSDQQVLTNLYAKFGDAISAVAWLRTPTGSLGTAPQVAIASGSSANVLPVLANAVPHSGSQSTGSLNTGSIGSGSASVGSLIAGR
jgi:hypothetical protein